MKRSTLGVSAFLAFTMLAPYPMTAWAQAAIRFDGNVNDPVITQSEIDAAAAEVQVAETTTPQANPDAPATVCEMATNEVVLTESNGQYDPYAAMIKGYLEDPSADRIAYINDAAVQGSAYFLSSSNAAFASIAKNKYDLVYLSDEFKYFAKYESSQDYDQGLSAGDDYHALGYYQLDNRYELQDFLTYCYEYDQTKFGMFANYIEGSKISSSLVYGSTYDPYGGSYDPSDPYGSYGAAGYGISESEYIDLDLSDDDIWQAIKFEVDSAWHEAYQADPGLFSTLQDTYLYYNTYVPAEADLLSRGIDISGRADCIKGLCWGVANLFGLGGWHRFVGGEVPNTGNDGVTTQAVYTGCGLDNTMSDIQFATSLASYISENVASFYPSQPQYHQGWSNRYKSELQDCLNFLTNGGTTGDTGNTGGVGTGNADAAVDQKWYTPFVDYAVSHGIMTGYDADNFGVDDNITRGQLATILWRLSGQPELQATPYSDVDYTRYYGQAINWARNTGIINGYTTSEGFAYNFGPEDFATREQVATILTNFARSFGWDVDYADQAMLSNFPDANQISPWARSSLAWCVQSGVISGSKDDNGTAWAIPQNNCTRAQMAKMIVVLVRDILTRG